MSECVYCLKGEGEKLRGCVCIIGREESGGKGTVMRQYEYFSASLHNRTSVFKMFGMRRGADEYNVFACVYVVCVWGGGGVCYDWRRSPCSTVG